MKTILLIALFILSGCSLTKLPNELICSNYGVYSGVNFTPESKEEYRQEIQRRNLLTVQEIEVFEQRKQVSWYESANKLQMPIFIGMSQCAMYASLGLPTSESRMVSVAGVQTQHVYDRRTLLGVGLGVVRGSVGLGWSTSFIGGELGAVYTENGRVIGWQN